MFQSPTLIAEISAQLTTTKSLTPTQTWLSAFILTQRPTTPLPVLTQTALFRLLASDITNSLTATPTTVLPVDVHNAGVQERRLEGPIVAQVLAIEDMSKSRWEQIEAIEALERGEGTKGREIVRVVAPTEADDESANGNVGIITKGGPHKVLLQDVKGTRAYGIELRGVEGLGLGMSIGCKVLLKDIKVTRGVLLLEPGSTSVLGGKIEGLHRVWRENRKVELRAAIEASERP